MNMIRPASRHFMLIDRSPLVLQDMAETIRESDPAAQIVSLSSLERGVAAIREGMSVDTVIVSETLGDLEASGLLPVARERGVCLLILLGMDRATAYPGAETLQQPFTTDTLREALGRLSAAGSE